MDTASVDLVYADPPFNTGRDFTTEAGAFTDKWAAPTSDDPLVLAATSFGGPDMGGYIEFMLPRLREMRRILRPTGSIYLHCDPTASHYLKLVMDAVWGRKNFRNEIVWSYKRMPTKPNDFPRMHDVVLRYANGPDYVFNRLYGEHTKRQQEIMAKGYNMGSLSGKKVVRVYDKSKAAHRMKEWQDEGREVQYVTECRGNTISTVWDIPIINGSAKERTGYPTQKPLALLDRIIRASSNAGDLVFDPFCGCATSMVAAEQAGRRYLGCDVSEEAVNLSRARLGLT